MVRTFKMNELGRAEPGLQQCYLLTISLIFSSVKLECNSAHVTRLMCSIFASEQFSMVTDVKWSVKLHPLKM
jgi:hypothetical protein